MKIRRIKKYSFDRSLHLAGGKKNPCPPATELSFRNSAPEGQTPPTESSPIPQHKQQAGIV
jgi:hypothetical protein